MRRFVTTISGIQRNSGVAMYKGRNILLGYVCRKVKGRYIQFFPAEQRSTDAKWSQGRNVLASKQPFLTFEFSF
jgi:hypothetical protein